MCKYEVIEGWRLSNGKTIREINNAVHDEVERIYLEAWAKGISVPYFEGKKVFLANSDGSDDEVTRIRGMIKAVEDKKDTLNSLFKNVPRDGRLHYINIPKSLIVTMV